MYVLNTTLIYKQTIFWHIWITNFNSIAFYAMKFWGVRRVINGCMPQKLMPKDSKTVKQLGTCQSHLLPLIFDQITRFRLAS